MVYKWRNYEGVIARLVPKEDIKGLIKQDVVVGPGEQAIIIRNGKIEDSVTQTRLERIGGGFSNWLKKKLGIGEDLELLFIDTKEIDFEIGIKGLSKEHDEIKGTATIRMRIDPSQATKLISLIRAMPPKELQEKLEEYRGIGLERPIVERKELYKKEKEKKFFKRLMEKREKLNWYAGLVLLKEDLQLKIEKEIEAKVFHYYLPKYSSNEIRRNPEIRETMEELIREELRKTFDMWGLVLLDFYTTLEAPLYEELEEHRRRTYMEIDKASIDTLPEFAEKLRNMEREHAIKKRNMEMAFELKQMGILQEEDIKDILQERDIKRQEELLEFLKRKREKEIDIQWIEHLHDMKELFGEEYIKKYGVPGWLDVKEKLEQWKRAREEHEVDLRIKEFQATVLKMREIEAKVEEEKARMEAEKAKYAFETYEKGMEKERERTREMMEHTAKIMEASKQDLPRTLIQGQATPVVHLKEEERKYAGNCPNCGKAIEAEWKVCPYCGTNLK